MSIAKGVRILYPIPNREYPTTRPKYWDTMRQTESIVGTGCNKVLTCRSKFVCIKPSTLEAPGLRVHIQVANRICRPSKPVEICVSVTQGSAFILLQSFLIWEEGTVLVQQPLRSIIDSSLQQIKAADLDHAMGREFHGVSSRLVPAPCPAAARSSLQVAVRVSSWTSPLCPHSSPVRNGACWRLRLAFGIPVNFDPVLHILESRHGSQPLILFLEYVLGRSSERPTVQRNADDLFTASRGGLQTAEGRNSTALRCCRDLARASWARPVAASHLHPLAFMSLSPISIHSSNSRRVPWTHPTLLRMPFRQRLCPSASRVRLSSENSISSLLCTASEASLYTARSFVWYSLISVELDPRCQAPCSATRDVNPPLPPFA